MHAVASLPVLLVGDEPQVRLGLGVALRSAGFREVLSADDGRAVVPLLEAQPFGAVVLDLTMPHVSGRVLLCDVAARCPHVPVIVLTATGDFDAAVECMRTGATDCLVKPVDEARLAASLRRAREWRALHADVESIERCVVDETPLERTAFVEVVTQERAMFAIFRYLEAIAPSPLPVLITGETGTGKELMARAVHRLSRRPGGLVMVNAAGLDDTLFSDTLFGHVRGAFTGADRARGGLLSVAGDGTLFLDEIGDLSITSQVKLLRLLQDGSYYPLGADRPRQSRARVIVATNRDMAKAVAAGRFRDDLYYRLRTHHCELPPLRARTGDLPLLLGHFVCRAARTLGKPKPAVPPSLLTLLKAHPFPGNIRELEAMVFDAVARMQGSILPLQSFKDAIGADESCSSPQPTRAAASLDERFRDRLPTLHEAAETLIAEALARAEGNQAIAARLLGLSRQALNKRLGRRKGCASDPA